MSFQYGHIQNHAIWVGVRRIAGIWFSSNGLRLTDHFSDWAENEPTNFGNCAVASKADG